MHHTLAMSFVERFGLSGGMPTCVSIHRALLPEALAALGVSERGSNS